jgi:hypothetical protein
MKTLIIAALAILSLTAKANTGNEEPKVAVKMEVKQLNPTKVQLITNLVVKANESYEIQKSNDGKTFTTIAMILGTEETATMPALRVTDIVKKDTVANYRILKTEANGTTVVCATNSL